MDLKTYLKQNGLKKSYFAGQVGTSPSMITKILKRGDIPLSLAKKISLTTIGVVTLDDLLPKEGYERSARKPKKTAGEQENAR
jgi:hypothetical protein